MRRIESMRRLVLLGCLSVFVVSAQESLKFADVLTDNMVLQRGKPLTVWGTAPAGVTVEVKLTQSREEVVAFVGQEALQRPEQKQRQTKAHPLIGEVRVSYTEDGPGTFKAVTQTATADSKGKWKLELGTHAASFKPTYLAAKSGDAKIAIQNLLIGEVWIASGQSNMEFANTRDKMWENNGLIFNGIRYAKVRGDYYRPRDSFVDDKTVYKKNAFDPWMVCEDGVAAGLPTVPYLFAQYLHRRLKVPVGIIDIAQSATSGCQWCARNQLEQMDSPTVNAELADHDKKSNNGKDGNRRGPASLFNARLYPIRHLTNAGVIYLQGEHEALQGKLAQYMKTFPGVINSFREALGDPKLPFGIITLQGFNGHAGYAVAREIHLQTHRRLPDTGYIVAHDIGGNIHPIWKRPLAERAVYWALRDVYQVFGGASKLRIKDVTFRGDKALVQFQVSKWVKGQWTDPKISGSKTNDQKPLTGFEIAGEDQNWVRARIELDQGASEGILLSHPLVPKPVAVRYGWCESPAGNLGSWEDPSPPYRSDDWPRVGKDAVPDRSQPGYISQAARGHLQRYAKKERLLESGLDVAIKDSYEQLIKRYAHPKGILQKTVNSMQEMMQAFDLERCKKQASVMGRHALHRIPCVYWVRDRYKPERRAKWGWLVERAALLPSLPEKMEQTLQQKAFATKLANLKKALAEMQAEIDKLPDQKEMNMDEVLDIAIPIMEAEKERLAKEEGLSPKQLKSGRLSKNPF